MTTRGAKEEELYKIGCLVANTLKNKDNEVELEKIRAKVESIVGRYELFSEEWNV